MELVSLNSAYAGGKCGANGDFFEKVATVKEDETILDRFFTELCALITDRFKEFIIASSLISGNFTMELEVSGAYDHSLTPSVIDDVTTAIVAGITARWFKYTYPERAGEWDIQASTLLSSAYAKLCHRRKPSRATYN